MDNPTFLVIDLFCGFGGTTLGLTQAEVNGQKVAKVIACVNHDPKAINSHYLNHPDVHHFTEDIRTLELSPLVDLVQKAKAQYPDALLVLWASLECTNHSKAKGGLPRDADSRTLACDLFRYQKALQPDYIWIENVVEFMAWGPLDEDGKPLSRKNGEDWLRWRRQMNALGYWDDWRELNSANFGARTSRNRLFGAFARPHLPIRWPEATHAKKVRPGMFGSLKPWQPVKDVLDFSDEGESIFGRKKPLVEKTLERIYAGLIKYVAGGEEAFLQASNGGHVPSKVTSVSDPARVITTSDNKALVQTAFISKYFSGKPKGKNITVDGPAGTITCVDGQALVQPRFLYKYYGNGHNLQSVEEPAGTLTTKDRLVAVSTHFLDKQYSGSENHQPIDQPAGTITTRPKMALAEVRFLDRQFSSGKQHQSIQEPHGALTTVPKSSLVTTFLVNRQYNNGGNSTELPAPTIIATQNKRPLYLVQLEGGEIGIEVYETDSPMTRKIKEFMALYGIADIRMRMLKVSELLLIQGFPSDYQMVGTQSDHKKFIGNSVVPLVTKCIGESMAEAVFSPYLKQA